MGCPALELAGHWVELASQCLALRQTSLGELSLIDITWGWEVSGGPVSWTLLSHLRGSGLTPSQSTKTLSATWQFCNSTKSLLWIWFLARLVLGSHKRGSPNLLPNQVALADIPQAKMLRCRGLQQREGLFTRQAGDEMGEQISNPPPWSQGICGIKNKEAVWCEDLRKCDWRKVYAFFIFVFSWSW